MKLGKSYCESRRSGECAPMGASSFVVSRRAFQGLTRTAARDCALFLLPQTEQGQKERMATGASEKLAQEGLRGNRDRLAVGKRVSPCVRKVAHDLESMRGAGGLRRQYQTDRWVRMAFGTKPGRGMRTACSQGRTLAWSLL